MTDQSIEHLILLEPEEDHMKSPDKRGLIRVFVKGGILSPANLLKIMDLSRRLGNDNVHFGSRQDIMFPANGADDQTIERGFRPLNTDYELGSDQSVYQNIVSSYLAVNIVETTLWVKEDTYHLVIDNFDYRPKLKINIVDPVQTIVPLFTGDLNFIASSEENYWYLYIRDARRNNLVECWPRLVAGHDIAKLCKELEPIILNFLPFTANELYMIIKDTRRIAYKGVTEDLKLPESIFPYYEGLNMMRNNQYWLGLYWRDNCYDIDFMSAACRLCQETNISKINIIPWKAFVIKGIKADDRIRWEKLMGKFGINERHSSIELNWHLPLVDQEALELKRFLVRELDQQDISTHGLTFTIKTNREIFYFTSIVIEKATDQVVAGERYSVLYARDFDPNSFHYITYARNIRKEVIPAILIELSKLYFRQLHRDKDKQGEKIGVDTSNGVSDAYQCSNCLTIYDRKYGDPDSNVPAGIPFEKLPDSYKCHVCDSPKKYFVPVRE
jgi:rubredoxin